MNSEGKDGKDEDSSEYRFQNFMDMMNTVEWNDSLLELPTESVHTYLDNNGNSEHRDRRHTNESQMLPRSASRDQLLQSGQMHNEKSMVELFEPKFLQIFEEYKEHQLASGLPFLQGPHLLGTCLENVVNFSIFARKNTSSSERIHEILMQNQDLRPELRNGLSMILIYTFAAGQSAQFSMNNNRSGQFNSKCTDMFAVLQDHDYGLGIMHKTALRIYNDPYFYYAFLKVSHCHVLCRAYIYIL